MKKIIIIAGQTATGKSEIGFFLASQLNGEIINADSIQVYKYFNIGSAKPPIEMREKIPHHLIDILEPYEEFNAFLFQKMANQKIEEIFNKGKIPIIIGGTGLYIRCLLYGLFEQDNELIKSARKFWEEKLNQQGIRSLYEELKKLDPESADKIHENDRIRIIRALEFLSATGIKLSEMQKRYRFEKSYYDFVILVPKIEKAELIRKIEERTKKIFQMGIIDETKEIINKFGKDLKPLKSIGYKESLQYLEGKLSFDEAIKQTIKSTKDYAKRQLIWFKKEKNIQFIEPTKLPIEKIFLEKAKKFLHNIK